jgi:hypothetical protein
MNKNTASETGWQIIEYGIFASTFDPSAKSDLASQEVGRSDDAIDDEPLATNSFSYNPFQIAFPTWLPAIFCNGWSVMGLVIVFCLVFSLLILGKKNIQSKWEKWISWWGMNANIRNGLMYTQFPIHILNGLFSVVGPIFILRTLQLHVSLLGAISFAEQALQILTGYICGSYLASAGHKAAQGRAVILLALSAGTVAILPFLPADWLEASPWSAFLCYLLARLLFAWGVAQFNANYGAAINNSAFLPPHDAARALALFYFSSMVGMLCGSLLALLVLQTGLEVLA